MSESRQSAIRGRAGTLWRSSTLSIGLAIGLLCAAGPAEGRKLPKAKNLFDLSVLNPEVRESLEQIEVLLLHEKNLDMVWKLEQQPDLADVVLATCSPECHSSDVLEALASWSKQGGGGLFIGPTALFQASRFLFPESFFLDPVYEEIASGHSWLAADTPLTENVQQVHHELWCSRDGTGSLRIHLRGELERIRAENDLQADPPRDDWLEDPPEDDWLEDPPEGDPQEEWPEQLLTGPGELLQPVLTWGRFPRGGDRRALEASRPILLATSYQGARVVWYAYELETRKKCRPRYDDVRLWSNLMHWLAGQ